VKTERGDDVFRCISCEMQWVGALAEAPERCLCGAALKRQYRRWSDGDFVAVRCLGRPSPCNRNSCPDWGNCPSHV